MPKPKDIALYVLDHDVAASDLIAALEKHDAISLLPIVTNLLKKLYADRYPSPIIETAFPVDTETIKEIESKYKISQAKVKQNPDLLAGYTLIDSYKMYDNSMLSKVEMMFV